MSGATADRGDQRTKRYRLATELRRLRDLAGVSGRDLAHRIGVSQSKISRIESGTVIPSLPEVTSWADAVGASRQAREWLTEMTEAVFTEVHNWRAALQAQSHLQDQTREQEDLAHIVRCFQPAVVPGLLQTAEYARRIFTLFDAPYTEGDIAMAVAGRLQRQLALYERDRSFRFLITEAALRCRPGPPKLLLAQLDRIASLSTLENVSIGLVPHARQALVCPSHGFVLYESDDDAGTYVEVEMTHRRLRVHDAEDITTYQRQWDLLSEMAVFDDEARAFIAALGTEIRDLAR